MTPEERARGVVVHLAAVALSAKPNYTDAMAEVIDAAIRAAVEEEREACARVADDGRTVVSGISQEADTMARMIAAEIRWRKP